MRPFEVEFQSEGDDIEKVQIFRTTETPIASVSKRITNFGPEPHSEVLRSAGSSFMDTIEPNTKYFYMFRSVDLNGNVSNPTRIYRVEMISEDGLIFPIIELYDPKPPKTSTKYRKFAKHIEIKPAMLMSDPNWTPPQKPEDGGSWSIGSRQGNDGGVFGKNFLIRLTSIDTGRKIDIKVSASKKEEKIEDGEG